MNFDLSDDSKLLKDQARRFLRDRCPPAAARTVIEQAAPMDAALWRQMANLGWLGAAVPEEFGGSGMGAEALCVLAEELGYAVAPVPTFASTYLATTAVLEFGSAQQKQELLPRLASGEVVGTVALFEGAGDSAYAVDASWHDGKLWGSKLFVPHGASADFVLVSCRVDDSYALCLVGLDEGSIERAQATSIDGTRPVAHLTFSDTPAVLLGTPHADLGFLNRLADTAAVLLAFEQVGGAQACLDMACAYAKERHAFGRPIGSFQAIKHKLARMYIAIELARSNAYRALLAVEGGGEALPLAAALSRISATAAFDLAARENILVHGGIGVTWEANCHLYYRRSGYAASALGSASYWKRRAFDAAGA